MKRIIQFLSPIIFSLLFYMPVSANMLPSSGALSTANSFANQLASTYFADETGRMLLSDNMAGAFQASGMAPNATNTMTWEYKPLNFDPGATLYDSQGNVVDPSNVSLAIGRNSFTSETFLYDNSTGEIVNIGESFQTSETTLNGYKPGGSVSPGVFMPGGQVSNQYDPFESLDQFYFKDDNSTAIAIFRSEDATSEKIEYLETLPDSSWAVCENYVHQGSFGYYCVANVPGVCVNVGRYGWVITGGQSENYPLQEKYMPQFLLNSGYQSYLTIWNDGSDNNYNRNAVVRSNEMTDSVFPGASNYSLEYPVYNNNPFSGGYRGENSIFDSNASNMLSGVFITMPVTINTSPSDVINYDKFRQNEYVTNTTINNNYDQSSNVTTQNFPIYQTITYPTYSPVYNYYYYYDQAENTPGTGGGDIGNITDSTLPDNIPILSNLNKRFPFSIPWDIYNLVSGLAVERETPYIDTVIHIPVADVDWVLQYDLHAFDDTAQLFRTLFLISFIIALAWFSYDHFFGS